MPGEATQEGAEQSIHDRIVGILGADDEAATSDPEKERKEAKPEDDEGAPEVDEQEQQDRKERPKAKAKVEGDEVTDDDDEGVDEVTDEDDADDETPAPRTLREVAERLGLDYDQFLESIEAETKIDGEDGAAPLAKLLKGYQLEGHLNRRLMEHADAKKAWDAEITSRRQAMDAQLQELGTSLQLASQLLNHEFNSVNWAELEQNNVQEFLRMRAKFEDRNRQLAAAHVALQRRQHEQVTEQQQQFSNFVAEQAKELRNKLPEWKDDKVKKRDQSAMREFLKGMGYSDQEIGQVFDHRWVLVIRDAMKYRELQQSKPSVTKRVAEAPKLQRPGSPKGKDDADRDIYSNQRKRLKQTGKVPRGLLERFV